jgi:hypothetical protein
VSLATLMEPGVAALMEPPKGSIFGVSDALRNSRI